tara:strand:+ start:588 stop:1040 length:453 start_codon:yes stop_codon:yes gene_type:complete
MSLKVGDKAPEFSSFNQNGENISLKDFSGKNIILYFYPRDNTPGCTAQACNLRDNYKQLQDSGYIVLGVSSDSVKSHDRFIKKHDLPFDLIADEDKSIHKLYGTWIEKKMYGKVYMGTARWTFIIDENGVIKEIIEKVKTKEHTQQIIGE